jgi:hypothetical protein
MRLKCRDHVERNVQKIKASAGKHALSSNFVKEINNLLMPSSTVSTLPGKSRFKKIIRVIIVVVLLIAVFLFWWNYLFVFGEGVKSGQLNYVVKKGNLFKTYEGKLIQNGLRSQQPGSVQSYEFEFSVADDSLANVLMNHSGNYYDLHYKEYKHALPWRGYSSYIVDKIVSTQPAAH